jgi:hypothetical protein
VFVETIAQSTILTGFSGNGTQLVGMGNARHLWCIVAQAKLKQWMVFDKWAPAQSNYYLNPVVYING